MLSFLRPLLLLLIAAVPLIAAAQTIAEVVYDGLPEGVSGESVTVALMLKTGATYEKAQLPADRDRVVGFLKDLGYLDADARPTVNFIPSGVRIGYAVKARNRYTVEAVRADGVSEADLAAIVTAAKIGKETPCTQAVIDALVPALAPKLGVNVLYVEAEWKQNADKKQAVLVLRK
jgi:outer membrane protein assembly factor BamA